jgi:hypothetical protein
VRCRVYDGVVSGKDITKWLLTSVYKYALDYTEAQRIAQGLLEADLLTPVCAGYEDTLQFTPTPTTIASATSTSASLPGSPVSAAFCTHEGRQIIVTDIETLATFKAHPSYIYRYPVRQGGSSSTSTSSGLGAFSLFGHRVVTTIPTWFNAEAEPSLAGHSDSSSSSFKNMFGASSKSSSGSSGDPSNSSVTNYTVRSCLLDEQWEVFRR